MKRLQYIAAALLALPSASRADTVGDCHIGAYRLSDGSVVDIGPTDDADLRWRRFDGTFGSLRRAGDDSWISLLGGTERPDGKRAILPGCPAAEIRFDQLDGRRIAFDVTEASFASRGTALAGRLVLPRTSGRVAVVVLVHGSESYSARNFYALQRLLPAEGVGVFVYDKRGTGGSRGEPTVDFGVLADDAVAAMREARRLAGARAGRVGYLGTSQGGWVAPLAAARARVDFTIVGYGLAVSPIDEDREEIELEMALRGHGREAIAKALEVAAAGQHIVRSGFTSGFAEFDAIRAKYRGEPWYADLRGNLTRMLLPSNADQIRALAPALRGAKLDHDPMPTLRALDVPQLWILGEDDLEAPSAETAHRLTALGAAGRPITLAMFPHAEHGIYEYETRPDGERIHTRVADGYYALIRDFARDGRIATDHGASAITSPRPRREPRR